MYKLFWLFILTCNLFSAELRTAENYEEARKIAKKEHKRIMLQISTLSCRWCKKLKATTLKDDAVIQRLNRDYISVFVFRGIDDYPKVFKAKMVPMSYFIDAKDEKYIMRGVMGYWSSEDYLSIMDDVDRYYQRKYQK